MHRGITSRSIKILIIPGRYGDQIPDLLLSTLKQGLTGYNHSTYFGPFILCRDRRSMAPLKMLLALAAPSLLPLALAKQVQFELNLTWQKGAPDGNVRDMIFMNDQFPGPELRLDQGDDVEVCTKKGLESTFTLNIPAN